jgi:hypothetical protein
MIKMKVGDLIRTREAWERTPDGGHQPRTDDAGWEGPMLVINEYPPPDEGLFVALWNGIEIVVSEAEGLTEIEVLNGAD